MLIGGQPRGHVKAIGDLVATAAYQPERQAVGAARRFVRDIIRSWQRNGYGPGQESLVDDAVLLTSELVTNAVLHAGTTMRVTCRLADGAVEITVQDYSPAQLIPDRQRGTVPAERTGGRGLALPAQLASSWGVTYSPGSKAVWFRIGEEVGAMTAPDMTVPDPPVPEAVMPDTPIRDTAIRDTPIRDTASQLTVSQLTGACEPPARLAEDLACL